ncbi:MAG TPA: hypothetical protein VEK73_09480 [Xanthobacteraceae bacterium]|nr:hypothetical protein [Xanthobacteraceae bacterium]
MAEHILITTATRKRRRAIPELAPGTAYDIQAGCWMVDGMPLVGLGHVPPQSTKKFDLETGEDQKGE